MNERTYVCIDLKSFYASVECVDRGLDPLTTKLVVADPDRTEKTICLAVTPAMKALGVKSRCRVFEIPPDITYIMATPRMQHYIDVSSDIYSIYLRYISAEDIHVYSIDEVFMDVTNYLELYKMSARELAQTLMDAVMKETGITATAGVGTNLYLAKIAMDIVAKRVSDHIGMLDEESYRAQLWDHLPLTDFWRIGPGISKRLSQSGIQTMREVAHAEPDLLYHLFGIDAELIYDHAWGRESATIADIKAFKPKNNSISSGQVLSAAADNEVARLLVREMVDLMCLDLVDKGVITDSITLFLMYSSSLNEAPSHGTATLLTPTSSETVIAEAVDKLFTKIKKPGCDVKRFGLSFNNLQDEGMCQLDLFTDPFERERELKMQKAMLSIKKKYGRNAVLKGMDLQQGAKTIERNAQIGGHRSGV